MQLQLGEPFVHESTIYMGCGVRMCSRQLKDDSCTDNNNYMTHHRNQCNYIFNCMLLDIVITMMKQEAQLSQ